MTKKEKELLKLAQEFCEKFIALRISSTKKTPEQKLREMIQKDIARFRKKAGLK